jgi:hypothetical protein
MEEWRKIGEEGWGGIVGFGLVRSSGENGKEEEDRRGGKRTEKEK